MQKKPSLIIIGFVSLLLIGGSLLAWVLFLREQESSTANPQDVSFLGDFPGSGASSGGGGGIFGLPIGRSATGQGATGGSGAQTLSKPILIKVYNDPTAGLIPYDTEEEAARVRFVDKATGDILEYTYETKNTVRVVRETIPRVISAVFTPNGKTVYRQYLDDAGILVTMKTPLANSGEGIQSTPLVAGTTWVAPIHNDDILALVRTEAGTILTRTKNDESATLWSSALAGWNLAFTKNSAVLYQNPSYDVPGVLYTINTTTNTATSPMGSVRGLVANPHPGGGVILFSRSGGNVTSLFTYDQATHTEQALPVRTLASKCAWSSLQAYTVFCAIPHTLPQRDMPDAWHRGEVLLQDDWYVVNTKTGERTILYNTGEANTVIDVERPMLNADETALFFINKHDESLWMLGIPKNAVPQDPIEPPEEQTEP